MPQTSVLRDSSFHVIGYIETQGNGDKVLKDASYRVKGYYTKNGDVTKDEMFHIVGYGDLLPALLDVRLR